MYNDRQYNSTNLSTVGTTTIFQGPGTLGSIIINYANTGGTITIKDMSSPNITIGTITLANSNYVSVDYFCAIANSLQIVTSASPNITVTWTK